MRCPEADPPLESGGCFRRAGGTGVPISSAVNAASAVCPPCPQPRALHVCFHGEPPSLSGLLESKKAPLFPSSAPALGAAHPLTGPTSPSEPSPHPWCHHLLIFVAQLLEMLSPRLRLTGGNHAFPLLTAPFIIPNPRLSPMAITEPHPAKGPAEHLAPCSESRSALLHPKPITYQLHWLPSPSPSRWSPSSDTELKLPDVPEPLDPSPCPILTYNL